MAHNNRTPVDGSGVSGNSTLAILRGVVGLQWQLRGDTGHCICRDPRNRKWHLDKTLGGGKGCKPEQLVPAAWQQ